MDSSKIETAIKQSIDQGLVPGLVAATGDTNQTTWLGAYGKMHPDSEEPITDNAIFRIASMTKAVTSVAIMQLVEQGQIDLDAPAATYLPPLADSRLLKGFDQETGAPLLDTPETTMTTRHLLTHTAGFGYEIWSDEIQNMVANGHLPGIAESPDHYLYAPLLFEPGSQWLYGINTDQLGLMVEAVSGKNLGQYMSECIFQPLGMQDSGFSVPEDKLDRLVSVAIPSQDGKFANAAMPAPSSDPEEFMSGGGGLVSTASDYLLFLRMLLNQGSLNGQQILRRSTVQEMSSNQIGPLEIPALQSSNSMFSTDVDFYPGITKKWGLGFMLNEQQIPGARAAGSLSWAGLYNSYYWIDPASNVTGVILMQVLPFFHDPCIKTFQRFEEAVYMSHNRP